MKKYDLHKNDFAKLQFEVKESAPYFLKYKEKATKPHRHSFFQILWFKESGRHYIDYKVNSHPKNSLFLINQNQVHYFCPESSNEGCLFHFNDSFIAKLKPEILARFSISIFNEIGDSHINLTEDQVEVVNRITNAIQGETEYKNENYSEIVFHQFLSLLYYIERIKKEQTQLDINANSDFTKIVQFKKLVMKNIDQSLSIDYYADQMNISTKKLTKLTKQFIHTTPGNLIKDMKILEAKRILSNQSISIKEVAYALGFDQPTYFTKFFKKETQLTPKKFQQSIL